MSSIVGSVVEFSPATRETGVRFPDNADFFKKGNGVGKQTNAASRIRTYAGRSHLISSQTP